MPRKYLITAAIVAVLVIVLAFYLGSRLPGESIWPGSDNGLAPADEQESITRADVPDDIVVPGKGDTGAPEGVAVPKTEIQAAPGASAKLRSFDINVSSNEFSPSDVIVNAGDTIHINFTAVDKNYDFTQPDYGFNLTLPKGIKKVLEFQAPTAGKFTFYCSSCGGPDKGPVGYITVVPKT